jgi:lipopolysaccharide transport system permease protein
MTTKPSPKGAAPVLRSDYEKILRPARGIPRIGWGELWQYRELFWALAMRTVRVRYKQTVAGGIWAIIQPLVTMIILTFIFGRLAKFDDGHVPYSLVVLAGILPWQLFASGVAQGANSLVAGSGMISKVYFPRLIVPTAACIVGVIDFLFAVLILAGMMIYWKQAPQVGAFAIPGFLVIAMGSALGLSFWLSALNVKYRDIRHVVPFMVQFGLYLSPVGFQSSRVPQKWRMLYAINPMVTVIDGFRWALIENSAALNWETTLISSAVALLLFVTGLIYFRKMEPAFADFV